MLNYTVISQLVSPLDLITLPQAKAQLRIEEDQAFDNDLIELYIGAALDSASQYLGYPVAKSDVKVYADEGARKIILPVHPVTAVTAIDYVDVDGEDKVYDLGNHKLITYDKESRLLFLQEFEVARDTEAVITATVVSGWDANTLPDNIRRAMLLEISDMYTYREDRKAITNKASQSLLRPFRKYG
jgi:uncharacterized phiE125 gp8 family phage protein